MAGLHAGVCPLPCYSHREAKTVSGRDTSGASAVSCPTASIAPLVSPAPQMRSGFVPLFSTGWEASQLSVGHPAPLLNSTDLIQIQRHAGVNLSGHCLLPSTLQQAGGDNSLCDSHVFIFISF